MTLALSLATIVLLLCILGGLVRVLRGPTAADRMLAAQLFGTAAVALLALLAETMAAPALRDVALVFALLAAVTAVAFVSVFAPRSGVGGLSVWLAALLALAAFVAWRWSAYHCWRVRRATTAVEVPS